jgi:hypothetical protein
MKLTRRYAAMFLLFAATALAGVGGGTHPIDGNGGVKGLFASRGEGTHGFLLGRGETVVKGISLASTEGGKGLCGGQGGVKGILS